jgi:D-alanyl-D-alanine carboxypeptidase (penicillin-binding protein 5/6)
VPIGSITKMMVAFVVLADYPLVAGASGPSVTVYQEDVDAYNLELLDGQSVVAIAPGEMLDEYQLLEGLLVHSSNDYAALLASLDAGSIDALVAKMNAEAQKLGLTMTHYTDVSGVDPGSVSTPHDQLILAEKLLANPVASSIVAMTSVDLPVSGLVTSYQPLLGSKGVVGVKSGLTSEAGGCDVMAVDESIAGHPVEILAAVTGQQGTDRLASAGDAAMAIVSSVDSTIQRVPISGNRVPIANLGWPKSYAPVNLAKSLIIPAWPGQKVTVEVLAARRFRDWLRRGQIAAYVVVHSATFSAKVPAKIVQDLHEPTLLQRVV